MIPKRLEDICSEDIRDLVVNSVSESVSLEFKRDLPGTNDEAKKEFLADVSALANTIGGDVIYGIAEENGSASCIYGVNVQDIDAEILRLNGILNTGLEPRIRHTIAQFSAEDKDVLLLRVQKSWNAPHRIVFRSYDKFFARTSAGKYPLDVQQLRSAFLESASLAERMRNFRSDRLAAIIGGATPIPMPQNSKFVLHALPFESFFSEPQYDVHQQLLESGFVPLGNAGGWSERLTFEGKMSYATYDGKNVSYIHLYRSGIIELVEAELLSYQLSPEDQRSYIPSIGFERYVIEGSERSLKLLRRLQARAPIALAVTLTNVKNMVIGVDDWRWRRLLHPVLNEHLFLPEVVISDLSDNPQNLLRPIIDQVWNACGVAQSPNFAEDGSWMPPR